MCNFASSCKYICDKVRKICKHTDIHTQRQTGRQYNTPLPHPFPYTCQFKALKPMSTYSSLRFMGFSQFIPLKSGIYAPYSVYFNINYLRNYLLLLSPPISKLNQIILSAHLLTLCIYFLLGCLYMPGTIYLSITHLLVYIIIYIPTKY